MSPKENLIDIREIDTKDKSMTEKEFQNKFLLEKSKTISSSTIPEAKEYQKKLREFGSEKHAQVYAKVVEIAQAISEKGGRVLLVGGSVRDMMMKKISKDFDVEVYGLTPQKVEEIIKNFGKIEETGKSFGILKIFFGDGLDIDVSCPRIDSKTDEGGHTGFDIKVDPFMKIEEAAKRRDFTINSLAADPLTGTVYDPFGGVCDIENRILKITDEELFCDDPLRVLRAIQFISRFGLKLDQKSAIIIREISFRLKEISEERIFEEWKKLFLKSQKPSIGLAAAMTLNIFDVLHPELASLSNTPQDPEWHPEGDAWIHSLMALDEAAKLVKKEQIKEDDALVILLAALCHDLGKPETTKFNQEKQRITSYGHEEKGKNPTSNFLTSINATNFIYHKVTTLAPEHMKPTMLFLNQEETTDRAIKRLAERLAQGGTTIRELVLVSMADHFGRGPYHMHEIDIKENGQKRTIKSEEMFFPYHFPAGEWLYKEASRLKVLDGVPETILSGKDLIELKYTDRNNKDIGTAVSLANVLRDELNYENKDIKDLLAKINQKERSISKAIETIKRILNEKVDPKRIQDELKNIKERFTAFGSDLITNKNYQEKIEKLENLIEKVETGDWEAIISSEIILDSIEKKTDETMRKINLFNKQLRKIYTKFKITKENANLDDKKISPQTSQVNSMEWFIAHLQPFGKLIKQAQNGDEIIIKEIEKKLKIWLEYNPQKANEKIRGLKNQIREMQKEIIEEFNVVDIKAKRKNRLGSKLRKLEDLDQQLETGDPETIKQVEELLKNWM